MNIEEKITNLKGEVDEMNKRLEELKKPVDVKKEERYQDKILDTSGSVTSIYLGDEVYPLIDTDTSDHGELTGLTDDDHTQYHTDTRGDAKYIKKDGTTSDISEDIPLNTHKLTGVVDPTSDQDAATKKYVDDTTPSYAPFTYVAGDNLLQTSDTPTSISKNSTTPVKFLQYTAQCNGVLRIKWQATIPMTVVGYMRIYRNGAAVGVTKTLSGSGNPTYMSDDVSGWTTGDYIQIYGWRESDDSQDVTMAIYDAGYAEGNISAIYGDWAFTNY